MDVSNISRVSLGFAQYAAQAKNMANGKEVAQNKAAQTQSQSSSVAVSAAFELDISVEAKQAAQQTAKQEDFSVEDEGAKKTKGLSAEQVDALKSDLETQEQTMLNIMIQALTESNDKLFGWLEDGVGILNFGGIQIDAARFGLPEVATNPEDAAKAIAPGGAWSVDAVSTRIFDLASAIAGNDPEKLSQMRAAVEEGFKQAGITWKDATGQDNMPEISKQTYNEIMSRFDKRTEEINGTAVLEPAVLETAIVE